jgi:hypothetical protein
MSGIVDVTAKKNDAEGSVAFDFGENLEEMVILFDEGVTFSNARAQMKIGLQAAMRRRLEAGQPVEDLATTYKPGVQMERIVDPIAAAKAKFATMNDEDKAAFLEDLRAM